MSVELVHQLRAQLDSTFIRTVGLAAAWGPGGTVRVAVGSPSISSKAVSYCTLTTPREAKDQIRGVLYAAHDDDRDCIWHHGAAFSRLSGFLSLHLLSQNTSRQQLEQQAVEYAENALSRAGEREDAADVQRFVDGTELEICGHDQCFVW